MSCHICELYAVCIALKISDVLFMKMLLRVLMVSISGAYRVGVTLFYIFLYCSRQLQVLHQSDRLVQLLNLFIICIVFLL